jgi:hypothetical protein
MKAPFLSTSMKSILKVLNAVSRAPSRYGIHTLLFMLRMFKLANAAIFASGHRGISI